MIRAITPSDPATVLPRATLKAHLRVDGTDEDALIDIYAAAAVRAVETYTGRSLGPATWRMSLAYLPDVIDIGVPDITAVTKLTIVDSDGVEHEIPAEDMLVQKADFGSTVEPAPGVTWPTAGDAWNACEIEFTAGYASVPADVLAALLLTATTIHRGRGDGEMPRGARSLVAPYLVSGWR